MRALVVVLAVAVIGSSPVTAAAQSPAEDDPKLDRAARESAPLALPDEDDPKLTRSSVHRRYFPYHVAPRFKLAYRYLPAAGLEGGEITFHAIELDYYPASFRYFRFGLDTEIGYAGGPFSLWYFTVGPVVGFQWPGRVTPFLDARFVAGLAGGSTLGVVVVSHMYTGGLEGGIELYLGGRYFVTAALGWAHPVYSAADINYVRMHPTLDPPRKTFSDDVFTFKLGLGL